MKPKQIITGILLLFVCAAVGAMIYSEMKTSPPPTPAAITAGASSIDSQAPESATAERSVIAYYFYGNVRCMTCRKIEAYTQEALETGFAEQLQDGRVVWMPINVEEPGNEHFVQDYQLSNKSVVISAVSNGEQVDWKNLEEVWSLTGDKEAFLAYIQSETAKLLDPSRG